MRWVLGVMIAAGLATSAGAQDLRPKPRPVVAEDHASSPRPMRAPYVGAMVQTPPTDAHDPIADPDKLIAGLPFVFAASAVPLRPGLRTTPSDSASPPPAPVDPEISLTGFLPAAASPRPVPRPAPQAQVPQTTAPQLAQSLRPKARPAGLARSRGPERVQAAAAIRPAPGTGPMAGPKGSVCGNPAIQGQRIAPIVGRVAGCGVADPVRITSVAGVRLSQPATVNCTTAQALNTWVERGLKPAFGNTGGGVVAITVPAHYACRTRNHRSGAKLSEHAKGNAVDVSIIHLANGQQVSVLRGWRGEYGAKLRAAHKAACGIFKTTLGPGSDGMHEDHFHYDVAPHRRGTFCR